MTEEEAKKKQLLAAYAWGRHSAAAPECFALDPDKLVALCALGVMPPKVGKGAGSTPATGSAGKGVSVGEQPAATCVATTTNTMSAGEKTAGATPAPWELLAAWVAFLSAQATIDSAGFMDNYTDAARAREQQARAIKAARAAIAKAEGRE